jgi:hypothetical protein
MFKGKEKVIALDEDVYFTTGETLKFFENAEFDLAWANWWVGVNAGIIGINFKTMEPVFPLTEKLEYIEAILKEELLGRAMKMGLNIVKIPTRDEQNYFGDGSYTNDTDKIKSDLVHAGILK